MLEQLQSLAESYRNTGSSETLAKLYQLLEQKPISFNVYFNNPNGSGKVTGQRANFSGTFQEFANKDGYETPDMLEVIKDTGETVYVQFSDLLDS